MSFVEFRWIQTENNLYEITDTDFVEREFAPADNGWQVIINTYKKRNLNVASNIVKASLWWSKHHISMTMDIALMEFSRCRHFAKYKDDVEKYLVLL